MRGINDLRTLRHFVLVAEELNFTRAAARANLSQTPFGRSIHALEDDLGLRLFDRTTRSVRLTATGRQVLAHARNLLGQARTFDEEMRALAGEESGEIAFGASHFAIDTILPGILARLRRQSPRLQIHVRIGQWKEMVAMLDADEIEFFVAFPGSLTNRADYRLTALPDQPASLFCRADHPLLQLGRAPTRDEALKFPWGALDISNTTFETITTALALAPETPLPVQLNCPSKELLLEAMQVNDMIAATWRCWLNDRIANGVVADVGQCIRPALPESLLRARCALVERADRTLSPPSRRLKTDILNGAR